MELTPHKSSFSPETHPGSGPFFDGFAARYDLLNRILSFGLDVRWRARAVAAIRLAPGARVLDLATGTADLAIAIASSYPGVEVLGIDPSPRMLEIGARKVARRRLTGRVRLELGDAQHLKKLSDRSFDAITMAFGIRNIPDRDAALREMVRLARPGAPVAILELGEPRGGLLGRLARWHVHVMVPWVGALLSSPHAYRYLQRSVSTFPPAPAFVAQMTAAGVAQAHAVPLTFGVCHLYLGHAGGSAS